MKRYGLTAAAAAHDLVQTSLWNLLRQRFFATALELPSAANCEGWTDLDAGAIVERLEVLLSGRDVSRSVDDDGRRSWLAQGPGEAMLVSVDADGAWAATAAGPDERSVAQRLAAVCRAFPVPAFTSEAPSVLVRFWAMGSMGPFSYQRRLDVSPWSAAAGNYPDVTAAALDDLMAAGPPDSGGRLILFTGPPGVGKTHSIRSLAHAWSPWCDIDYIVDADEFFGVAAYMVSALVMGADDERWRLVVIEDSGEFLVADRNDRPTQGLSRLLNLTDGLVGQGLKLLVLMTTNEQVGELHGAVTRPGRCMANIGFGAFTADEAVAWLDARGVHTPVEKPMSLAELFATVEGR